MSQLCKILLLSTVILTSSSSASAAVMWHDPIIESLASPKGVAAVGMTYALLNGISNFVWAFDWTRAGASNETKAIIQEVGGLSAAGESILFGFFIPFWCYQYLRQQRRDLKLGQV